MVWFTYKCMIVAGDALRILTRTFFSLNKGNKSFFSSYISFIVNPFSIFPPILYPAERAQWTSDSLCLNLTSSRFGISLFGAFSWGSPESSWTALLVLFCVDAKRIWGRAASFVSLQRRWMRVLMMLYKTCENYWGCTALACSEWGLLFQGWAVRLPSGVEARSKSILHNNNNNGTYWYQGSKGSFARWDIFLLEFPLRF